MLLKVYKSRVWMLLLMLLPFIGNAQIPGLPAGWGFTLNPTSATYAVPTAVTFEGVTPLANGDWIGVFYEDGTVLECGGAIQWDGVNNVAVVAFGNDGLNPDKNGFADSELVHWKFFYEATQTEICVKAYDALDAEFNWVNGDLDAVAKFTEFPIVTCPANMQKYINDPAFALTGGLPVGGVYSGPGVASGIFTPATAGLGIHTITYTYTEFDCSDYCTFTIQVLPPPCTNLTINLATGYQFISSNVIPADLNFKNIMTSALDNLAFARNSAGKQLIKFGTIWNNQIGNWEITEGYLVKMNGPDAITMVCGTQAVATTPINLTAGYKFVSYLRTTELNAVTAFGTILDNLKWARNSAGKQLIKFGTIWNNQIGNLKPAEGYLLNMNGADVLVYPASDEGMSTNSSEINNTPVKVPTTGHWPTLQGDPTSTWSIFPNTVYLESLDIAAGDEMAIFDGTKIVGQMTFSGPIIPEFYETTLVVWKILPEGPGYTPGNAFTFKFWDQSAGVEVLDYNYEFIDPFGFGYIGTTFPTVDNSFSFLNINFFEPVVFYDVTTSANPAEGGTTSGDGTFEEGTPVTVSANEAEGWNFVNWTEGGVEVATTATYIFDITADRTLVANFIEEVAAPVLVSAIPGDYQVALTWEPIPEDNGGKTGHWPTLQGDPTSTWSIFPNTVYLNGGNIEAGDEMAIFDGIKIVGQMTFSGPIIPDLYETTLVVWKILPEGPGYTPGNAFTFKFWDQSAGVEILDYNYEFIDPFGFGYIGTTFPTVDNSFSFMNINFLFEEPFTTTFNIYQDGIMVATDIEVTNYVVLGLNPGQEYCFFVTQNLPDVDAESGPSNIMCAIPGPFCQDVVITNFPETPANVCVGTPVSIDFTGVVAENAASVWMDNSPVEAGGWANSVFVLNTNYVGVVTITYVGYATPPCLDATESLSFEVYPLPVVTCPDDFDVCINDAPWELYGASPEGGDFSGLGVVDNWYYPALAGEGTHEIAYVYTDDNGCVNSCSFLLTVNPLPFVECPVYDPFCEDAPDFDLPEVVGGTYWLNGMQITQFLVAEFGTSTITLVVTDENGCSNSCDFTIVVNELPDVTCPENFALCVMENVELTGATPVGGVYSGEGVEDGFFYSIAAGIGPHVITYTYEDGNGCVNSCEFVITVNDLPAPVCPPGFDICIDAAPVVLTGAEPQGGTYGGAGVIAGEFNPALAGLGYHELFYTYTDPETGCTGFCVFGVTVNPIPEFDCPAYGPFCEGDDYVTFEGNGMFYYNNEVVIGFDPIDAGEYIFEYVVGNEFNCFASCEFTIVVNPVPIAACPEYDPVLEGSDYIEFPIIIGGEYTFEGTVVTGFNPVAAGNYTFALTVTNEFGCVDVCEFTIVVNPIIPPVCPGWANLQWPPLGTIDLGGDHTVYAQIWIDGVTQLEGPTPGLSVAIGYCTENTDPAGWTNWVPASFNLNVGNNDEFMANIGAVIPDPGVYYYASRFVYNNCDVVYGGYSEGGGNFWDGVNYVSGVLTVIGGCQNPATAFAGADAAICAGDSYLIADATATNYEVVQWFTLTGDGYFSDETALNPTYYPGFLDMIVGSVELCMVVTPSDPLCDPVMDCMTLTINPAPEAECPVIEPVCEGSDYIEFPIVEMGVYTDALGEVVMGFDPVMAGTYGFTLTVTNEFGCIDDCEFTIVVNPLPTFYYELSATEICFGESITYTNYFTGTAPWTVEFNANGVYGSFTTSDNPEIFTDVLSETTVYEPFAVTDGTGCTAVVNQPSTITVNPLPTYSYEVSATEICFGEEITWTEYFTGTAPWTIEYYWNGVLESFTTSDNPSFTTEVLDESGIYEPVTVTDGTGCSSPVNQPITITVHPLPVFDCPAYGPYCEGDEAVALEGEGVYTLDGEVVVEFEPAVAGEYLLVYTVTTEFDCSASCEFVIVVNPLPTYYYEISDTEICSGQEVTYTEYFTGTAPWTVEYYWNGVLETFITSDNPSVTTEVLFETSVYEPVSVTDGNGCTAPVNQPVTITVLPLVDIIEQPANVSVFWGEDAEFSVVAENATGYQWFEVGFGEIFGANWPTLTLENVTVSSSYYCVVSNECGSETSDIATLTVNPWLQVIPFPGKVSGMSTYLDLMNCDIATIMAPLGANLVGAQFYQPSKIYAPGAASFCWDEEKGSKVTLKNNIWPTSITVTGYPTLGTVVDLQAGWNIMPVWSLGTVSAADVFGPLGSNLVAAFSVDYSGVYWPAYGVYSLEFLVPGSAYLVAVNAAGTVDFDVPIVDATPGYVNLPPNMTSWNDVTLTGIQHNIAITTDALASLQIGDVIGAFNQNGNIAGMVEVTNLNENIVIRVYGDEMMTKEIDGFVVGDMLTFRVYRNGVELDVIPTFDQRMPNTNIFSNDGLSAITALKAGATSVNDPTLDLNVNVYPNPAKDFVNIQTNFEIKSLKVVNYVGQVVFDQNIGQINYQINTSNFGSGMYFVQIETNDGTVITKRLTIN